MTPRKPEPAPAVGNGWAAKALIALSILVAGVLTEYFSWLGLAVIELKVGMAEANGNIKSLLKTRTNTNSEAVERSSENARRLDRVESARPRR